MSVKFVSSQIHIHFVEAVLGSDHQLLALKNGLAKSVSLEEKTVNFDDVGVSEFRENSLHFERTGFKGNLLEILCRFCKGLVRVYKNLLHPPHDLTGDEYEAQARIYLGFQPLKILPANLKYSQN